MQVCESELANQLSEGCVCAVAHAVQESALTVLTDLRATQGGSPQSLRRLLCRLRRPVCSPPGRSLGLAHGCLMPELGFSFVDWAQL